jgi:hypothetical protein
VTSCLDGLHFSYDHTSASNYSTPVTPESYQRLLTEVDFTSEINIGRNISISPVCLVHKYPIDLTQIRSLASLNSEKQEDQRRIVLSWDTSLRLELDLAPGPGHPLFFDALEIPFTQSVKYTVDQERPKAPLAPNSAGGRRNRYVLAS